jgi:hypothetical protein
MVNMEKKKYRKFPYGIFLYVETLKNCPGKYY